MTGGKIVNFQKYEIFNILYFLWNLIHKIEALVLKH